MDPSAHLRERLRLVADAADGITPFEAIGFALRPVEDAARTLVWIDHRRDPILEQSFRITELPSAMGQRGSAPSRLLASDLDSDRPFDRVLLARRVGALLVFPVASISRPTRLWVAVTGPLLPTEAQERALEALARLCELPVPLAETAAPGEPEQLHRLEFLDQLLTTLTGVLDVRNVFVRISEIAKQVIAHDCLGMPTVAEDGRHFIPYARAPAEDSDR